MSEAIAEAEAKPAGQPENIPVADAEPVSIPDAAVQPAAEPDYEAEYAALLASKEGEGGGKPEGQEPRDDFDPELHQQNVRIFGQNHTKRHENLDGLKSRLEEAGLSPIEADFFVKEAKDRLTEEHADALRTAGSMAGAQLLAREHWEINVGLRKALPAAVVKNIEAKFVELSNASKKEGGNGAIAYGDFFKVVYEEAKEAGRKVGEHSGFIDGRKHAEKVASAAKSEQRVNSDTVGGNMTLDQIDKMPNSDWLSIGSSDADGGHSRRSKILDDAHARGR